MPRKGENIYKRKDGRWEARYIYAFKEDGSPRYRSIYAADYLTVKKKQNDAKRKMDPRLFQSVRMKKNISFYGLLWLERLKPSSKESTYVRYHYLFSHYISPMIGDRLVYTFSNKDCEVFLNRLLVSGKRDGSGLAPKTVTDIRSVVKLILKTAEKEGELSLCNPELCPVKPVKKPLRILSLKEQQALKAKAEEITDITVLKKGMTNRSFLFTCKEKKYIMRIPGEGTDQLINRRQEASVYQTIDGKHICDDIAYINPENGYKITEFLEGARVCDPLNYEDVKKCMKRLHAFHDLKLKVNHEFDIFGQMEFYETLWEGIPSVYKDYEKTKANVLSLKPYINAHAGEKVLTHIDAVPDNFLFAEKDGREEIRLIDWEYAGMQDPHVDVAMFCIYSLYNKRQVDRLIAAYFTEGCSDETRIKIYCYIAACGLLWSNWCEYKRNLGVEFGEYSLRQYRYAKDYYRIVQEELKKQGEEE